MKSLGGGTEIESRNEIARDMESLEIWNRWRYEIARVEVCGLLWGPKTDSDVRV